MSEDRKDLNNDEDKVKVEEDGKATPTEETVEKIEKIQQEDPQKQTTSEPTDSPASEMKQERNEESKDKEASTTEDSEKEAKVKAAAEAREARAKAKAEKAESEEEAAPKEPSPNQPRLDRIVQLLKENISDLAVEDSYINEKDRDLPCLVIKSEYWSESALLFKEHAELKQNYLRNVSGVDQESHLEVVYHLLSLSTKDEYCVKVKTDKEHASIPSVTPVWSTANWNEREIYDLLGIDFPGHPDMRRIMMSDDWIGHPLRKDYEPFDPEV